jgi:glycosyltransferase involved in cell wall biosynthesis
MSLKLVFFNRSFWPDITATGQLLTELCEDLVRDYRCCVTVITGRPLLVKEGNYSDKFGIRLIRKENFKGIEILRVRNTTFSHNSFLGRISNYLTYFILSFIASSKLEKIDLVITLTDPPIVGLLGLSVSLRFNIPFVISVRDIFPEAARGLERYHSGVIYSLLDCINRFCLKKTKQIVVLGKLMARRLIEEKDIRAQKIAIIPDWADCSKIFPVSKNNPFSLKYNLINYFVVMYSGNLGVSAGLETLIESAKILRDYKDILFVFIGEGVMKAKIVELGKRYKLENLRFFPYQSQEVLPNSLSTADVFVIPLKRGLAGYSVPSKIYAILASGRPYIACVDEESEIAEITENFKCGLLAKPEDPQDLSKKIIFLYENKDLRIKMAENARYAAQFFDRSLGVKSYYELFKRCLGLK